MPYPLGHNGLKTLPNTSQLKNRDFLLRRESFNRGTGVASHNDEPEVQMESKFRNEVPDGFFLTNVPYDGHQDKTFHTQFEMLDSIGKGSASEVFKCQHKQTKKLYAVKGKRLIKR